MSSSRTKSGKIPQKGAIEAAPLQMIPGPGYVFQKGGKFPVKSAKDLLSGNVSRSSDAFSNPSAEKEKHDEHVKISNLVKSVLDEIESEVNVNVEDEKNW